MTHMDIDHLEISKEADTDLNKVHPEENESSSDDYDDYEYDSESEAPQESKFKNLLPTSQEEREQVEARYGKNSLAIKAVEFINNHTVQRVFICLLLMDVLILFAELYLDAVYPACTIIERDAISCCPTETDSDGGHMRLLFDDELRRLGGGGGGPICESPLSAAPQHAAGCDTHKHAGVHTAHKVLKIVTISILSAFMVELTILLVCLGPRNFFSRFLYVLDFFVVSASLALEVAFYVASDEAIASLIGLLVVARIWRFVRIGHGLVVTTNELKAVKEKENKEYIRVLQAALRKAGQDIPPKKKKSASDNECSDTFKDDGLA